MRNPFQFSQKPETEAVNMIAGWHQWADGGSTSSGLPKYLIQETKAAKIGHMSPDGYYLFQIPGTHDLVRPVVQFDEGFPRSLQSALNDFYITENAQRSTILFIGEEPHLDVERYTSTFLDAAQELNVKCIIGLGGVFAELPYDRERPISCIFSLAKLKTQVLRLGVTLSDYGGGASIGSYICKRAGERNIEYIGLYTLVPTLDFSSFTHVSSIIRIEQDYTAWLGVMRRINYLLKTDFSLSDLEDKSRQLTQAIDQKVDEIVQQAPQAGIREYIRQLSEAFPETTFDPLDDIWGDEIRRILDDLDKPLP